MKVLEIAPEVLEQVTALEIVPGAKYVLLFDCTLVSDEAARMIIEAFGPLGAGGAIGYMVEPGSMAIYKLEE